MADQAKGRNGRREMTDAVVDDSAAQNEIVNVFVTVS